MNTVAYFEIQSSNPKRECAFYSALFGWEFIREAMTPIEYYRIETNGINGGLLERPVKIPPKDYGTNSFCCSIQVENFDQTAAKIIELGGQIALPKFGIPGRCWQGYFLDMDHNVFGIFEVDENAK